MTPPKGTQCEWDVRSKMLLIELYRSEPCLWDTSVEVESSRRDAAEAWLRIKMRMKEYGFLFEINRLKRKMKQLRDQFHRENRVKNGETVCSKWHFYDSLSFLTDRHLSNAFRCSEIHNDDFVSPNEVGFLSYMDIASPSNHTADQQLFDTKSILEDICGTSSGEPEVVVKEEPSPLTCSKVKVNPLSNKDFIDLSRTVTDELIRQVLCYKNILLRESTNSEQDSAWKRVQIYISKVLGSKISIDEIKQVFNNKAERIQEALNSSKINMNTSVHGTAQAIEDVIEMSLEGYSEIEKQLARILAHQTLPLSDAIQPLFLPRKKIRTDDQTNRVQNGATSSVADISPMNEPPSDNVLRQCLADIMKAQTAYFTMARQTQQEQLQILSSLRDILTKMAKNYK